MNEGYSERDLLVAEKLGALTSTIVEMDKKNDDLHHRTSQLIDKYCEENERQHKVFWKILDSNTTWINRMKGGLALMMVLWGMLASWVNNKFGK